MTYVLCVARPVHLALDQRVHTDYEDLAEVKARAVDLALMGNDVIIFDTETIGRRMQLRVLHRFPETARCPTWEANCP